MNDVKSKKYSMSPNGIEKKSWSSEQFKTLFNFKRTEQSKKCSDRLDKCDEKKSAAKKRKLYENFNIC